MDQNVYAEVLAELEAVTRSIEGIEQFYKDNKIVTFKPLRGQEPFFRSRARGRLAFGSNRSGKSVSSTAEEIAFAHGYRPWLPKDDPDRIVRLANGKPIPVPNVGYHLLDNLKVSGTQVFTPKMEEWLPKGSAKIRKNNLGQPTMVEYANGSKLHVLSQEMSVSAAEGASGHYAVSDEPPRQDMWLALTRGLIDNNGVWWIAATPIKASVYMAELMSRAADPDSGIELFSFSIDDNRKSNGGYLDDDAVDAYIASLPEHEIMARVYGKPSHLAGAVFPMWRPTEPYYIDPFDIPPHWPRLMGIDPAGRKPMAVVWVAVSPDNIWYVYREIYTNAFDRVETLANEIKRLEGWYWHKRHKKYYRTEESEPVVYRLIDTSANVKEQTSGLTIRQRFAEHDLHFETANKVGYLASIDRLKELLAYGGTEFDLQPRLQVFRTCPRLAHEFMNFVWQPESAQSRMSGADAPDKPLKTNDDEIDILRYLTMTMPTYGQLQRMFAILNKGY